MTIGENHVCVMMCDRIMCNSCVIHVILSDYI